MSSKPQTKSQATPADLPKPKPSYQNPSIPRNHSSRHQDPLTPTFPPRDTHRKKYPYDGNNITNLRRHSDSQQGSQGINGAPHYNHHHNQKTSKGPSSQTEYPSSSKTSHSNGSSSRSQAHGGAPSHVSSSLSSSGASASHGTQHPSSRSVNGNGAAGQTEINAALYKTELCRKIAEGVPCNYQDKCRFAHSIEELRTVNRHKKYKTEYCKNFTKNNYCPYGSRCTFIHEPLKSSPSSHHNSLGLSATLHIAEHSHSLTPQLEPERPHDMTPPIRSANTSFDGSIVHTNGGFSAAVSSASSSALLEPYHPTAALATPGIGSLTLNPLDSLVPSAPPPHPHPHHHLHSPFVDPLIHLHSSHSSGLMPMVPDMGLGIASPEQLSHHQGYTPLTPLPPPVVVTVPDQGTVRVRTADHMLLQDHHATPSALLFGPALTTGESKGKHQPEHSDAIGGMAGTAGTAALEGNNGTTHHTAYHGEDTLQHTAPPHDGGLLPRTGLTTTDMGSRPCPGEGGDHATESPQFHGARHTQPNSDVDGGDVPPRHVLHDQHDYESNNHQSASYAADSSDLTLHDSLADGGHEPTRIGLPVQAPSAPPSQHQHDASRMTVPLSIGCEATYPPLYPPPAQGGVGSRAAAAAYKNPPPQEKNSATIPPRDHAGSYQDASAVKAAGGGGLGLSIAQLSLNTGGNGTGAFPSTTASYDASNDNGSNHINGFNKYGVLTNSQTPVSDEHEHGRVLPYHYRGDRDHMAYAGGGTAAPHYRHHFGPFAHNSNPYTPPPYLHYDANSAAPHIGGSGPLQPRPTSNTAFPNTHYLYHGPDRVNPMGQYSNMHSQPYYPVDHRQHQHQHQHGMENHPSQIHNQQHYGGSPGFPHQLPPDTTMSTLDGSGSPLVFLPGGGSSRMSSFENRTTNSIYPGIDVSLFNSTPIEKEPPIQGNDDIATATAASAAAAFHDRTHALPSALFGPSKSSPKASASPYPHYETPLNDDEGHQHHPHHVSQMSKTVTNPPSRATCLLENI